MSEDTRDTKFKPGKSGNPGGRPKWVSESKELCGARTPEAIERLVYWMRSEDPRASVSAANAILDRALGKPAQAIEHTGQIGFFDTLATALLSGAYKASDVSGTEAGAPEGSTGSVQ